ncbi:MAG: class I SAM-dependent methyltransferase [Verrucomicrobia bacterium]|nr:class I SAM-dependent methyltransferase [Verrucomicrobiota bacterium]
MQQTAFEQILVQAARKRAALPSIASGDTNTYRLIDGEGDGVPGLFIDVFAGHWLVQTRDAPFPDPLRMRLPSGCRAVWWKELTNEDSQRDAPKWITGSTESRITAVENRISYSIDFAAGYSQGIFLDQRDNRAWLHQACHAGHRVLNLFAYTCAFSVVAGCAGAVTASVDLSRNYLDWGKRNFALNPSTSDAEPEHQFFAWDTFDFLKMAMRKGERYHFIVCDPPTFSRNKSGKVFRVEKDYHSLIARCAEVAEPGGIILCSTNHRALPRHKFEDLVRSGVAEAGLCIHSLRFNSMPGDFTGEAYLKSIRVEIDRKPRI